MSVLRVFCGWDARESAGWHVFAQSVIENASVPVALIPIGSKDHRDGTNAFTYSRFLVPYLCGFKGRAVFVDGADMLVRGDIAELFGLWDFRSAVMVVKHEYTTEHHRKYVGTSMECANENYPRKNWSSVILWDCENALNRTLTPEQVSTASGAYLHRFNWLPDDRIGGLPASWNWLADEYGENKEAKLLHWTAGIPGFKAYRNAPHADEWMRTFEKVEEGYVR